MKVYEVGFSGTIEVQAESPEEAREMAVEQLDGMLNIQTDYAHEIQDLGDQS